MAAAFHLRRRRRRRRRRRFGHKAAFVRARRDALVR